MCKRLLNSIGAAHRTAEEISGTIVGERNPDSEDAAWGGHQELVVQLGTLVMDTRGPSNSTGLDSMGKRLH